MKENIERNRLRPTFTIRQADVKLSAALPVRVQELAAVGSVRPHDHDYYELCLVESGRAIHQTAAGRDNIGSGTAIIVPVGAVHAFEKIDPLNVTNVYYLSEWLLDELRDLWDQDGLVSLFLARSLFSLPSFPAARVFPLSRGEMSQCRRELADIVAESARNTPSRILLRAAMMKCLVILSRAYVRHAARPVGFEFQPAVRTAIDEAERCIDEIRGFSVRRIAQEAHVSSDYLARVFRNATGMGPMQYYQRRRIQKIAVALLKSRTSVTDLAYQFGYSDAAHLSRKFAEHQGISPRAYRKRYGASI